MLPVEVNDYRFAQRSGKSVVIVSDNSMFGNGNWSFRVGSHEINRQGLFSEAAKDALEEAKGLAVQTSENIVVVAKNLDVKVRNVRTRKPQQEQEYEPDRTDGQQV
jgi:hypothetical protein